MTPSPLVPMNIVCHQARKSMSATTHLNRNGICVSNSTLSPSTGKMICLEKKEKKKNKDLRKWFCFRIKVPPFNMHYDVALILETALGWKSFYCIFNSNFVIKYFFIISQNVQIKDLTHGMSATWDVLYVSVPIRQSSRE